MEIDDQKESENEDSEEESRDEEHPESSDGDYNPLEEKVNTSGGKAGTGTSPRPRRAIVSTEKKRYMDEQQDSEEDHIPSISEEERIPEDDDGLPRADEIDLPPMEDDDTPMKSLKPTPKRTPRGKKTPTPKKSTIKKVVVQDVEEEDKHSSADEEDVFVAPSVDEVSAVAQGTSARKRGRPS